MFTRVDTLNETSDATDLWSAKRDEINNALIANDAVYRSLAEEKVLGWKSEALNLLWMSRKKSFKNKSGSKAESSKRFTPEEKKYFEFYLSALPSAAPNVFSRDSTKTFLDIGCAPGGLSKFFISLGWRGTGFSLSPEEGGLTMRFTHPFLEFSTANMAKDQEWRRVTNHLKQCKSGKFDFCNLGVVIDVGQVESDSGAASADLTIRNTQACKNQLLIMLRTLKNGGNSMFIHSVSHVDSFFFYVDFLVDIFEKVTVINTLVPSRSPVYVILSNFLGSSHPRARQLDEYLQETSVRYDHPEDWQVDSWEVVERILKDKPDFRKSIHEMWSEKLEKLRESRTDAEQRLKNCRGDAKLFVASQLQALMPALSGSKKREDKLTKPDIEIKSEIVETMEIAPPSVSLTYICGLTPLEEKMTLFFPDY